NAHTYRLLIVKEPSTSRHQNPGSRRRQIVLFAGIHRLEEPLFPVLSAAGRRTIARACVACKSFFKKTNYFCCQ
ncbi:hypothetical protein, partial [Collimonas sp. OK307]|uniref:hypothetical protein n=1 Tax=Collimonas sp. OK307 TaxID=1801620 RepID=UPI001C314712